MKIIGREWLGKSKEARLKLLEDAANNNRMKAGERRD